MKCFIVDTNVILRYLLRDNDVMYHGAVQVFELAEKGVCGLFIDPMVIAECIYVLTGPVYQRNKTDVAQVLTELLLLEGVSCEDTDLLTESLSLFSESNVDFTDAYLACRARRAGHGIVSFEHDFRRLRVGDILVPGENYLS